MIIAYNIVEIPKVPGLACLLAYQHAVPEETWRNVTACSSWGNHQTPAILIGTMVKYDNEPMDLQIPYFQTNYHMICVSPAWEMRNDSSGYLLYKHTSKRWLAGLRNKETHTPSTTRKTPKTQPKKTIGKCETSLYAEFFAPAWHIRNHKTENG